MKSILLAASAAFGLCGLAIAAPVAPISQVTVTIGPELEAKAGDLGQRDLDQLAVDLRKDVEGALTRSGASGPGGARLELVLADAIPNRPTYQQLGNNIDLSPKTFGIGGAKIEGALVFPDGARRPVSYAWKETNIRNVLDLTTWGDAHRAFDQFAYRVSRGDLLAAR